MTAPVVAIRRCDLGSSDAEVEAVVRETVALAGGLPERVRRARKVLVKFSIWTEYKVTTEQATAARRAAIEQAAVFRERREELLRQYDGQYVYLRDGRVEWASPTLAEAADRAIRLVPKGHYGLAIQVLSEQDEVERVGAYRP